MTNHITFAYSFDGKGKGSALEKTQISKHIKSKNLAWVHLDANNPETKLWLEKEISYLDPYVIEALLAEETRPRMTQIDDGALIILRGVNLNDNSTPEDMVSIRIWIDKHRIISIYKRNLKAIEDIVESITKGSGPKNAGDFISLLVEKLFARINPVLSELDDNTDHLEESIIENANTKLREDIVSIRKKAIIFRRYMSPQRDAIAQLRMSNLKWLNELNKRHLQESYNNITRYIEDLDAIRERAQIIKDELASIIAEKLNKNMYTLSVIAAIFLPLGFLTGLLGINVAGIPGADNSDAFMNFIGILAFIVLLQIAIFKKFKWF